MGTSDWRVVFYRVLFDFGTESEYRTCGAALDCNSYGNRRNGRRDAELIEMSDNQ